ncbi:Ethylene-responsive transcription factor [Thalictrum thalictroides]|uniref:Ethylene-responsive transcription factor n=1 Tax=Thalictrum thalictroides TaxID=46969 RepID=A0A7J6XE65_THATH|nr:Ethylene-responsive transcription factor [Thalictrum thalictroides]
MEESSNTSAGASRKYKGIRCRKWGKWVSEIRVPNTQERLWLGSYNTPEAAAVAHDTALFCLRGPSVVKQLNFPMYLPHFLRTDMSPKSIQKAATDAGSAVDAGSLQGTGESSMKNVENHVQENQFWDNENDEYKNYAGTSGFIEGENLSISVEDMEIYL